MTSQQWDERYSHKDLVWTPQPNRFLVSELAEMAPGRALDIACGEGRNAVWLATQGWNVTGVDFSPVAIEKARQLAAASHIDVEWVVADTIGWDPPAGSFDLVVIFYLHLPSAEFRTVLEHAVAALAAGGTLLVVGHALRNLTDGYGGPPSAEGLYSPDDVAAELSGLVVERADEVLRPVPVDDGTATAIDALVRARLV